MQIEFIIIIMICSLEADPNYKPVFGRTEPKTSRIPVKSTIGRRFEKAHQRQFTKQVFVITLYRM